MAHTSSGVDRQLPLFIYRSSQTAVVVAGVIAFGVAERVVNVFGGLVTSKTLRGDFELGSAVARYLSIQELQERNSCVVIKEIVSLLMGLPSSDHHRSTYPNVMNPKTQMRTRIASALTCLTVPTSTA